MISPQICIGYSPANWFAKIYSVEMARCINSDNICYSCSWFWIQRISHRHHIVWDWPWYCMRLTMVLLTWQSTCTNVYLHWCSTVSKHMWHTWVLWDFVFVSKKMPNNAVRPQSSIVLIVLVDNDSGDKQISKLIAETNVKISWYPDSLFWYISWVAQPAWFYATSFDVILTWPDRCAQLVAQYSLLLVT